MPSQSNQQNQQGTTPSGGNPAAPNIGILVNIYGGFEYCQLPNAVPTQARRVANEQRSQQQSQSVPGGMNSDRLLNLRMDAGGDFRHELAPTATQDQIKAGQHPEQGQPPKYEYKDLAEPKLRAQYGDKAHNRTPKEWGPTFESVRKDR